MARTSPSPTHRQQDGYRPDDRRKNRSPDSRPRRRSRSRSPTTNHHSPRRSPRPASNNQHPLSYDDDEPEDGEASDEDAPPLPDEAPPPLPTEAPPPLSTTAGAPGTAPLPHDTAPQQPPDDGWEPVWEASANAYYFYNRFTGATQWDNPRVPGDATLPPQEEQQQQQQITIKPAAEGGYNPAIHGSYDPNADYARQESHDAGDFDNEGGEAAAINPAGDDTYASTATFNRFTGKFQTADKNPGQHTDDAKANRQMGAYFDVDTAMNKHDGRSLRAERQQRKLTKEELKAFKQRAKEKKEQKRRAWLRD